MSDLIKHYLQLVGIAKNWAMQNIVGWSEDSHRDLLQRYGAMEMDGRISARTMNVPQLGAVLDDYERRGWSRQRKVFSGAAGDHAKKPVPPRISHLVRLWGKLGDAGKVEKATRPALLAFCARQTGRAASELKDLDTLTVTECQKITEAMKGWLGR